MERETDPLGGADDAAINGALKAVFDVAFGVRVDPRVASRHRERFHGVAVPVRDRWCNAGVRSLRRLRP